MVTNKSRIAATHSKERSPCREASSRSPRYVKFAFPLMWTVRPKVNIGAEINDIIPCTSKRSNFFRAFAKLRKVTVGFVVCVRLSLSTSVLMEQLGCH